ncbi:efflux RND transporter periplasmic adaptor subunit [Parvibaculum sp.]|uniref:efflux RND transporter periplasmic adaptor subunit n=1 Tax=Parvibaculum sp. TaxID=2024848 RepID=UPI00391CE7C8
MSKRIIWTGGAGAAFLLFLILAYALFLRAPSVGMAVPERGMAVEAVYATGTVEPVRYARVGSKIAGRVTDVLKHEGDKVEAGDILLVIDVTESYSQLQEAQARLQLADSELDRAQRLRRSGNVSEAALDQARSAQAAASAALRGAKARLDDHFITAPVAGEVLRSEYKIKVGDMVQPGQILYMVGDPGELNIDAEVDEEDIVKVRPGQEALIRADAFPGRVLEGNVVRMTPFGDPVGRTYRIHIELPRNTPLISGMTTEINIVVRQEANALLVPLSAISGNAVWTVREGRAERLPVTLGAVGSNRVEVLSGLEDDTHFIVQPPAGLKDGDRLRAHSEG